MDMRDSLRTLILTCALLLVVTVAAWIIRQNRPVVTVVAVTAAPKTAAKPAPPPLPTGPSLRPVEARFLTFPKPRYAETPSDEPDTLKFTINNDQLVFVLYYVDALDALPTHPQRVSEQARHFGDTSTEAVLESGREAMSYVATLLKTKNYHVLTRWERQPNSERYYALVLVEYEKGKWSYLCDLLVRQGYARVHGTTTPLPDDKRSDVDYLVELRNHARFAREKHLGIWSKAKAEPVVKAL
jgi:endonuclease YncB( thermonuclease family)